MTNPAPHARRPSFSPAQPLPRAALLALAAVALLLATTTIRTFYWPAIGGLDISGTQIGRDFINTWAGPQIAFAGRAANLYDLAAYQSEIANLFGAHLLPHNFSYSPLGAILFWPFGQLPYGAALIVWLLATFAALAAVMLSQLPRAQHLTALALLAVSPAVVINAVSGQNGCLSGALLLGGLTQMDRRPVLAGVLFGLLTYKPHLGLVLAAVLVARGAWHTIAAAAATTALLVALSVGLFGTDPWRLYFSATSAIQLNLLQIWQGFFTLMMPTWFAALRFQGLSYQTAMTVQTILTLAVVASAIWAARKSNDPAVHGLIVAAATPLALPYAFNYDLPALAVACVWIMLGQIALERPWQWVMAAAWLAPLLSMQQGLIGTPVAQLALTGLYACTLITIAKTNQTAPAPVTAPSNS